MTNVRYFRYGHVEGMVVKAGQFVKKGDKLAVIADQADNGGWSPHLHLDCWKESQNAGAYTSGMSMEKMISIYEDCREVIRNNNFAHPAGLTDADCRWGYTFAEMAHYASGNMLHPGWDYNWGPGATGDEGKPVFAVSDATVVYAGDPGSSWGGVVVIKVIIEDDMFLQDAKNNLVELFGIEGEGTVYATIALTGEAHKELTGTDQVTAPFVKGWDNLSKVDNARITKVQGVLTEVNDNKDYYISACAQKDLQLSDKDSQLANANQEIVRLNSIISTPPTTAPGATNPPVTTPVVQPKNLEEIIKAFFQSLFKK